MMMFELACIHDAYSYNCWLNKLDYGAANWNCGKNCYGRDLAYAYMYT